MHLVQHRWFLLAPNSNRATFARRVYLFGLLFVFVSQNFEVPHDRGMTEEDTAFPSPAPNHSLLLSDLSLAWTSCSCWVVWCIVGFSVPDLEHSDSVFFCWNGGNLPALCVLRLGAMPGVGPKFCHRYEFRFFKSRRRFADLYLRVGMLSVTDHLKTQLLSWCTQKTKQRPSKFAFERFKHVKVEVLNNEISSLQGR